MKTDKILVFCAILLVFAAVNVYAFDPASTLSAVEDYALQTGVTSGQTALLLTWAIFDPDRIPEALRFEQQPRNWFCATPAIIKIVELARSASPEIRMEIEKYIPISGTGIIPPKDSKEQTKTFCPVGQNYFTTNDYQTEHFNFRWGTSTSYTLTDMQAWGVIFEEIWDIQVETWGYEPVMAADDYYIDVYLANSGDDTPNMNWTGAFTSVYYDDNWQPVIPYMAFHPDILGHEGSLKDVSSHEFFHTLQYTISLKEGGCYGYVNQSGLWTIEGTAVWAEDQTYPELNYYAYHIIPYSEEPHFSLISEDRDQIYGRVIWWKYVYENFDGANSIFDLWNECHNSFWNSVGKLFEKAGTDTISEYNKYVIANLFMDYEEGDIYPPFKIHKTISNYPQTYESVPATAPQLFGMNYIKLQSPSKAAETLVVEFEGDTKIDSRTTDWSVQLVAMKGQSDFDVLQLTIEDGKGTYELGEFGTTYSQIYAIVSPVTESPSTLRSGMYDIHFTLGSLVTDDDDDDQSDDDDGPSDDPEDIARQKSDGSDETEEDAGCGC